jgi:integrase
MNDLYQILFGPDWEPAARTADDQLREWAAAFDAWLDQIETVRGWHKRCANRYAWQDFWETIHRLPWQVEPDDVERWITDLKRRKRAPTTIYKRIGQLKYFYKFRAEWGASAAKCDGSAQKIRAQQVDPGASPAPIPVFNPFKCVKRPHLQAATQTEVMSREEVHALLEAVDREQSLVGRRDYAMILTALVTGKESGKICTLRWGDLPRFIDEAPGAAGLEAAAATHRAIDDYLHASGRRETIVSADFVFASLSDPLTVPSGKAGDWNPQHPLSSLAALHLLKRYAHWAGLDGERVNWHAVRNTGALLRLEAGETTEGLQAFLGHSQRSKTEEYIRHLAGRQNKPLWLPAVCKPRHPSKLKCWQRHTRNLPGGQPGSANHLKHGFSVKRPSLQEVLGKLDPGEIGLEWETLMLRAIMHRAVELCQEDISPKDWLHMMEGFSMAAQRLSNLLRAGNDLKKTAHEMINWDEQDAFNLALNDVIKELGIE